MNKYDEMSDLEVNKKLAAYIGLLVANEDMGAYSHDYRERYPSTIWVAKQEFGNQVEAWEQVNYCLTANDMWPIIVDNNISITHYPSGDAMTFIQGGGFMKFKHESKNALRSAAITFLMMKDMTE